MSKSKRWFIYETGHINRSIYLLTGHGPDTMENIVLINTIKAITFFIKQMKCLTFFNYHSIKMKLESGELLTELDCENVTFVKNMFLPNNVLFDGKTW